eukprot:8599083-Pyramimonas_sp.AAC.1
MVERSQFNKMSVRQLIGCLELDGWTIQPRSSGPATPPPSRVQRTGKGVRRMRAAIDAERGLRSGGGC